MYKRRTPWTVASTSSLAPINDVFACIIIICGRYNKCVAIRGRLVVSWLSANLNIERVLTGSGTP